MLAPPNSYRIAAYGAAARRLNIDLVVASEGHYSLVPEVATGVHVDLSSPANTIERLRSEQAHQSFTGIVAADDQTVELASQVAQAFKLPYNSVQAARISRRKDLARMALAEQGISVPGFRRVDLRSALAPQISGIHFPCVVKPLALSGSRGVIRTDTPRQLADACQRLGSILATVRDEEESRYVLVEDFLPGREVAVEGLLSKGELHVLAVFDKPEPLNGPYFEETYYITPSRLSANTQLLISQRVSEACAVYGLREGPIHAELRLTQDEAWILEVAARTIGGECARLLRFSTDQTLEELVLSNVLRPFSRPTRTPQAAGVMMIPTPNAGILRRVEGILTARKVPYIEDVEISIREGYELIPLPEGSSYLGFIFAQAPTPEQVEWALRRAYACLAVVVAPVWRLHNLKPRH